MLLKNNIKDKKKEMEAHSSYVETLIFTAVFGVKIKMSKGFFCIVISFSPKRFKKVDKFNSLLKTNLVDVFFSKHLTNDFFIRVTSKNYTFICIF